MKRSIALAMIAATVLALLTGCSTLGGVVDGTGKAISKGGRAVKNL